MRTVVESEGHGLGSEVVAEDLAVIRRSAASLRRGLLRQHVAELRENLLAIEARAQECDVSVPLFAAGGAPARGELREDTRDLFAVGKLDGEQVVVQRLKRIIA